MYVKGWQKMFKFGLVVAIIAVSLDQINKWYMLDIVDMMSGQTIHYNDYLDIVMVWNQGISFGLFQNEYSQYIFSALSSVIIIILLIWLKKADRQFMAIAIGFIIGGAIGNIIDRTTYGAVADFYYFHLGDYYWPAFNIADSTIFIGAAMLIIDSLFLHDHNKRNESDSEETKDIK